jgi:hypothetical protein
MAMLHKRTQRRHREFRRTHEDQTKRHVVKPICCEREAETTPPPASRP